MKHFIIPIFIPHHGCPNQCVFCNQRLITGTTPPVDATEVRNIIAEHLARVTEPRFVEVAFYGGSFTALPACRQVELLTPAKEALDRGLVSAIRLSTRPDAIDNETVERLIAYGVSTVELGAQSMDDTVLIKAGRGHTAKDTLDAAALIKRYSLKCGIQIMPGLPEEDWLSLIRTATEVVRIKPDFARIYPTVVIAGTELAWLYQSGQYEPLALETAVSRSAYMKLLFESAGIPVIRTGLQATDDLSAETVLAGPYHPAFGELVESFWFKMMVARLLDCFAGQHIESIQLYHHQLDTSKVRGLSNRNVDYWKNQYGISKISFHSEDVQRGEIVIEIDNQKYNANKFMLLEI